MPSAYKVRKSQPNGKHRKGRTAKRSAFNTSRVAEIVDTGSGDEALGDGSGPTAADIPEAESGSSDGSDDEDEPTKGNSYNALLQSLKPMTKSQPRKRRKLSHDSHERLAGHTAISDVPMNDAEAPASDDEYDVAGDKEAESDSEEELEEEAEANEMADSDDENDGDQSDLFETHFADPDAELLARSIKTVSEGKLAPTKLPSGAKAKMIGLYPEGLPPRVSLTSLRQGTHIKKRLQQAAQTVFDKTSLSEDGITSTIFSYQDLLYGARTSKNAEALRKQVALHGLNHLYKTRDRVIKNNEKQAKEGVDSDLDLRDQGFTRPKILVLQETRSACAKMVDAFMSICEPEQQENKKRFQDTFVDTEHTFGDDRPEDFRELFDGNDDNDFRIGLKFTRKTAKYFSKFYTSDIILASPLGLRRAIDKDPKNKDADFLSSIELVIVNQADAILMQNWEHVEYIFSHLNLQPKDAHGCDFSRVRPWYLDGHAAYLRQTIVLSAYITPELNALFTKHMRNVFGKVRYQPVYTGEIESLGDLSIKQTFSRFDSLSPAADPDARFKYFTSAILPSLTRLPSAAPSSNDKSGSSGPGILIFIPSYFDFVRLRNHFATSSATANVSFGGISEYSTPTTVRKARSHFATGRHSILLYTGRAHHFARYRHIQGVKRVVMYGVPENPVFYRELVGGYIGEGINRGDVKPGEAGVRVVFSKWDVLRLERVVGSGRVGGMIRGGSGDTFDFV